MRLQITTSDGTNYTYIEGEHMVLNCRILEDRYSLLADTKHRKRFNKIVRRVKVKSN